MRTALALTLAGLSSSAVALAAIEASAVVEQPRPFGHVVGDVIVQRVLLAHGGRAIEPSELPPLVREGVWFERRAARIETRADGQRWLVLEHQVVNAPRDQAITRLPAWSVQSAGGDVVLKVPAWPLTVQALASPPESTANDGIGALRPDRPAPRAPIDAARQRTLAAAAACALVLLAWAAWWGWRNRQAAQRQPFARALRSLATVDPQGPEAWQLMHRAFDETAGQVTRIGTLPAMFDAHPELAVQRASIERFYAQSAQRFFGVQAMAEPLALQPLAHALRRIERSYEP
ncbi:MAG TPA: calcium incorporation protein MxaA [Burkholderiaceae bacterium]|nr:calcium incorporation protein MxaA [Burkholderiaceae bacterium]